MGMRVEQRPVMKPEAGRRAALLLLAIAAVSGALAYAVSELQQQERDGHAIRAVVAEIERQSRNHVIGYWLLVEGVHGAAAPDPAKEGPHRDLLQDLERLGHVDDLRLLVLHVDVTDASATADYLVHGSPRSGDPPAPAGGQFSFRRGEKGWLLDGYRLWETATDLPTSPDGAQHGHQERMTTLVAALIAVAALASLAGGILLVLPWLANATRGRTRGAGDGQ
jgi:hypothetical protein